MIRWLLFPVSIDGICQQRNFYFIVTTTIIKICIKLELSLSESALFISFHGIKPLLLAHDYVLMPDRFFKYLETGFSLKC